MGEQRESMREQRESVGEYRGAESEHMNEMGVGAGAEGLALISHSLSAIFGS